MNVRILRQGGWVASFVIVGVLLTLGLLGSIYFIKTHQAQDASSSESTPASQTKTSDSDMTKDKTNSPSADNTGKKDTTSDKSGKSGATTTEDGASSGLTATTSTDSSKATATDADLPTTGPEDAFASVIVMTLLAFSVAAYLQSRRHRA